jgi:hypothetical protein
MERKQIRLDEQAEQDAALIQDHYSLNSRSAAIRFALRFVARLIEAERDEQRSHQHDQAQ